MTALAARLRDWDPGPESGRPEHRCAACGYGVVVSDPPPTCPMCRANRWDRVVSEPAAQADWPVSGVVVDELAERRRTRRRFRLP
jgi:hypothetical protein